MDEIFCTWLLESDAGKDCVNMEDDASQKTTGCEVRNWKQNEYLTVDIYRLYNE